MKCLLHTLGGKGGRIFCIPVCPTNIMVIPTEHHWSLYTIMISQIISQLEYLFNLKSALSDCSIEGQGHCYSSFFVAVKDASL